MTTPLSLALQQRRVALIIIATAAALLVAFVTALSLINDNHAAPLQVGHIHGIAVVDGTVLIGAHSGVFSVAADGTVAPYGDRRSDTMALATVGDRLLASGHPGLDEPDAPINEGLLRSDDAAQTWQTVTLAGQADFHALDGSDGRLWGLDAVTGQLLTSTDSITWSPVASQPYIDIAADPTSDDSVLAITNRGALVRITLDGTITPISTAPVSVLVASAAGELVSVGPDGQLWSSGNGGAIWQQQAVVSGAPEALTVAAGSIYVATTDGLYTATNAGGPFDQLFAIR